MRAQATRRLVDKAMYLLVADIGGTRARFRLLEPVGNGSRIRFEWSWPSAQFDSLTTALQHCLGQLSAADRNSTKSAWLAVAGPVAGGAVQFSNLPWKADTTSLRRQCGLAEVHLVNDLEALAWGIPELTSTQVVELQSGNPDDGPRLVIAAGTGLGMAALVGHGERMTALGSEAGHCDLAPGTEREIDLLRSLQRDHPHVSYERALSGSGLAGLYDFARQQAGSPLPADIPEGPQRPAAVTRLALGRRDPIALEAVSLFTQVLGSFTGNAALTWLATGGVFLAGGVVAGLQQALEDGEFLRAFTAKGRMRPLLERIPVAIVTAPEPGLEGISRLARKQQRNH
ncbi:MAG: glucokinase [Gammaproteobacteria bacterium]|nr:MAG: glucokinase [Gammaproteobacteria bacterium]